MTIFDKPIRIGTRGSKLALWQAYHVEEMLQAARKIKHRRIPLYDESPDTVVGILNTEALLLDPQVDLSEAIEFPSFVPESMNLLQLLKSRVRADCPDSINSAPRRPRARLSSSFRAVLRNSLARPSAMQRSRRLNRWPLSGSDCVGAAGLLA